MSRRSQQAIPQNRFNTPQTPNASWDQLHQLAEKTRNLLMSTEQLRPLIADQELQEHVEDRALVGRLLNAIAKDTQECTTRFMALREAHKDRSGPVQNDDEMMETLDLSLRYFDITSTFEGAVVPNVAQVMEMYMTANERRKGGTTNPEGTD